MILAAAVICLRIPVHSGKQNSLWIKEACRVEMERMDEGIEFWVFKL